MKIMSWEVYQQTKNEIDVAFKEKNKPKIEKETSYIFSQLVVAMLGTFRDRLDSISFDPQYLNFDEVFITSEKSKKALNGWLDRLIGKDYPVDDYEFGKLKVDFEEWFLQIGGRDIQFEYREGYLLKSEEAVELLGVSNVTLNEYVKQGFEYIPSRSQYQIPRHMISLWKDPVYCLKVQVLFQEKNLKNQKIGGRYKEVIDEIFEFQMKYKAESAEKAFPVLDGNKIDYKAMLDFYEWESLEKEYEELKGKLNEA